MDSHGMRNRGRVARLLPAVTHRPDRQQRASIRERGPLLPPIGVRQPFLHPQRPFNRRLVRDNDNPDGIPAGIEGQNAAIEAAPRHGQLRHDFDVKAGILFVTIITAILLLFIHLLYASCRLPLVFAWAYLSLAVNTSLLSPRLGCVCAVCTMQLIAGLFVVLLMVIVDTKLGNSDTLRRPFFLSRLAELPENHRFYIVYLALVHALLCFSLACLAPLFETMRRYMVTYGIGQQHTDP